MALWVSLRGPGLMIKRPIIGISCCLRSIAFGDYPPTPHHTVFHKYVDFIVRQLKAVPILLPATREIANNPDGYTALISRLDGVLLTGSPSNIGVRWQQGELRRISPVGLADYERDFTTFRLIHNCVDAGVPLLGICRGMQEINVAFGGELHNEIHSLEGFLDHRSDKSLPYERRYDPRHSVKVLEGTLLEHLLRNQSVSNRVFDVNSLHGQGIALVGQNIAVEAVAEDGIIEAISLSSASAFTMGVQWHIEWADNDRPLDLCISNAFRTACEERLHTNEGKSEGSYDYRT